MKSRVIGLTKGQALRLARRGGFVGRPDISATKHQRGAFGEGLVKGWLESKRYKVRDRALLIRAEDFGLSVFPSLRRFRIVEIVTVDDKLAVEVKTYSAHHVQGTEGETLEDQLVDNLRWRDLYKGRELALALVNYFGKPGTLKSDQRFVSANRIPVLSFIIDGMS